MEVHIGVIKYSLELSITESIHQFTISTTLHIHIVNTITSTLLMNVVTSHTSILIFIIQSSIIPILTLYILSTLISSNDHTLSNIF